MKRFCFVVLIILVLLIAFANIMNSRTATITIDNNIENEE